MIPAKLQQFLRELPSNPGIYRMLDINNKVIYVGKAKNLKNRVNSYFKATIKDKKTQALVSHIVKIEISITQTEVEALLLESSFIKKLRPRFNILLRDDKSYPFLKVSEGRFAKMEMYRSKNKPKKGKFFGPFPNVKIVRQTLNFIQKAFKIRNCSDSYFAQRSRPCLQYQIKRCHAPCVAYITEADYKKNLNFALEFLEGRSQNILRELEANMGQAVSTLAFEEAAQMRDQIRYLRMVQEHQGVVQLQGDVDVIAIAFLPGFICVHCVTIRDGHPIASQSFFPETQEDCENLWDETFTSFLNFYYFDMPDRIPKLIVTERKSIDKELLELALTEKKGTKVKISYAPRKEKKDWLTYAQNNLQRAVEEHIKLSSSMEVRFKDLEKVLGMSNINTMECFDISHTFGEATKASCVVFNRLGPSKRNYRIFNINGVTPGDDYHAMEQALTRRYKSLVEQPDLLIIDGGKGQVNIALKVLHTLDITDIKVIGIAKGYGRKSGWEKLLLADIQKIITLPTNTPALHLLQYIRDEAHRFAITAHRRTREKSRTISSLQTISGIGKKRRQALLKRFGGIKSLQVAAVKEIAKVDGISLALAEKIHKFLNNNN